MKTNESSNKERIFALDIGDLFLKFLLCEKEKEKVRAVIWGMEELNPVFWHRPLEQIWKLVQESYAVWNKKKEPVNAQLLLSFSSSVMKARLGSYSYVRKNPREPLGDAEHDSLMKSAEWYVANVLRKELALDLSILASDLIVKRMHVVSQKVDGYEAQNIRGLRPKEVVLELLAIFLLKQQEQIVEAIPRQYGLKAPFLMHQAEALLKFATAKQKDGVFLDIGERKTAIFVVKEGKLAYVGEIGFGGGNYTQILVEKLGMNANSARELKEQYAKQKLSAQASSRLSPFFLRETQKFVTVLKEKLAKIDILFPSKIFLYGGGSALGELVQELSKEQFQELSFSGGPAVSLLLPQDLWSISNMNQLTNPQYTPLFLELYGNAQ